MRIAGFDDIRVRVPNPEDDYICPIAYICDEELALVMNVDFRLRQNFYMINIVEVDSASLTLSMH